MNKQRVANFIDNVQLAVTKHSPEILTGIGLAGMITTTVLAVKATPKALRLIEEKKKEEGADTLTAVETIKTCWTCYIPATVTCLASAACIIGASKVSAKRNAALATAYKLSETALTEYREKVVETIGEKKEQLVRDAVDKERIEKNPVRQSEVIITEKGGTLFHDSISGRYFKSDIEQVKKSINEINRRMLIDMYVSLNELYDELGLDHIDIGDDLGWNIDNKLVEPSFSAQLTKDGESCIVLGYSVAPKRGYSSFM